jgi:hypothetical protein
MPFHLSRHSLPCGISAVALVPNFLVERMARLLLLSAAILTAIDTNGKIVASYITAQMRTPAFIRVSASAINKISMADHPNFISALAKANA